MKMYIDGRVLPGVCNSVDFGKRDVKQVQTTVGAVREMVGVSTPVFSTKTATFVQIIHGQRSEMIRQNYDRILKIAGGERTHLFHFDELRHSFRGVMKKYSIIESVPDRMTKVVITAEGQEVLGAGPIYLEFEQGEDLRNITIRNSGTYWSPAVMDMRITAQLDFTLKGLLRDPWSMKEADLIGKRRPGVENVSFDCIMDGETGLIRLMNPINRYEEVNDAKIRNTDPDWNNPNLYYRNHKEKILQRREDNKAAISPFVPDDVNLRFNGVPILAPGVTTFPTYSYLLSVKVFKISWYPVFL